MIQVLENMQYSFQLIGDDLPAGTQVTLTDSSGQSIPLASSEDGQLFLVPLDAGTYTVSVGGWAPGESASLSYQLVVKLDGQQDNAPPLVDGPAPALQITLASPGLVQGVMSPVEGLTGVGSMAAATPGFGPVVGPMPSDGASGVSGSLGGASGTDGSSGGGPGTFASSGGETGPASSGAVTAWNLVQNDDVAGLAGLGMSPLGGAGGPTVIAASPTTQVALNVPSGGADPRPVRHDPGDADEHDLGRPRRPGDRGRGCPPVAARRRR